MRTWNIRRWFWWMRRWRSYEKFKVDVIELDYELWWSNCCSVNVLAWHWTVFLTINSTTIKGNFSLVCKKYFMILNDICHAKAKTFKNKFYPQSFHFAKLESFIAFSTNQIAHNLTFANIIIGQRTGSISLRRNLKFSFTDQKLKHWKVIVIFTELSHDIFANCT